MNSRIYLGLLYGLAGMSGALLVWLMISVILSVFMRNMGMQPFAWLFTSAEYGLLYMTMFGAPWGDHLQINDEILCLILMLAKPNFELLNSLQIVTQIKLVAF